MRVLKNGVTDCREHSSCHCTSQEFSVHISSRLRRLVRSFYVERRGFGPSVHVIAVWTKPGTRSRGKARESVETLGIFLFPVFLEAVLSLARRWILCISFRFVVLFFLIIEVLSEGVSFALIGIEWDSIPTRLPAHVGNS